MIKPKITPLRFHIAFWLLGFSFCAGTVIFSAIKKGSVEIFFSSASLIFVSLPLFLELFSPYRLRTSFFIFFIAYILSPLLGSIYGFYYKFPWWDDLLHFCGGIVFSVAGVFIGRLLDKGKKQSLWMLLAFSLCFSVTASALWEFFEFSSDLFTGSDMQTDTLISEISSYLLGDTPGVPGMVTGIEEISLGGRSFKGGYIDIGLIDTMRDMILGATGAFSYVLFVFAGKGQYSALKKQD